MTHGSHDRELPESPELLASPEADGIPARADALADVNPYAAPRSALVEAPPRRVQLAEPWQRLVARMIDNVIVLALVFGATFVAGLFITLPSLFDEQSMLSTALHTLLAFSMYLLVQGPLLRSSGQTWGKRIFGIHIVDMSRRKPEFWKLAFVRELPFELIYVIPVAGQILGLINILMIARVDHRCGHDLLAGTQVVRFLEDPPDAGPPPA